MLNDRYILLPFRNFKEDYFFAAGIFAEESSVFIRPNSSEKLFTGRIFDLFEFKDKVDDFEHLEDNSLVVVSSPKKIIGEWRVICCDDRIIDYSCYRFGGLDLPTQNAPTSLIDFTQRLIKRSPLYNGHYTLDIAMLAGDIYKVIEANACFTAGLYACRPSKLLDSM
jgi:hypothetical protein